MRKILVIGGSRGIGAACVRRFALQGDRVAFTYKSSGEKAAALAQETGTTGLQCDAGNVEEMLSLTGRLPFSPDTLIYCAGIAHTGLIQDMTPAEWDGLFDTDVRGAFLMVKAFVPRMIYAGRGSILLVSSMWGEVGASCEAAYSAAKAALIGFARALAKELGPSGIRVNCVSPGVVDTDMMACYGDGDKRALASDTPLGRLGEPDDIARCIDFLVSDNASFITGADLPVNGGYVI